MCFSLLQTHSERRLQKSEREKPQRGRTNQQTLITSPMQPVSHRCSPTLTAPLHNQHSHYQRPVFMPHHVANRQQKVVLSQTVWNMHARGL